MLFASREVCIGKNCVTGLENGRLKDDFFVPQVPLNVSWKRGQGIWLANSAIIFLHVYVKFAQEYVEIGSWNILKLSCLSDRRTKSFPGIHVTGCFWVVFSGLCISMKYWIFPISLFPLVSLLVFIFWKYGFLAGIIKLTLL